MHKFFLGRYIDLNSILHQLDSRLKLIGTIILLMTTLLLVTPFSMWLLFFVLLLLIVISKIPIKSFYYGLKPVLNIILFTTILQLFMIQGGKIYWSIGIFHITSTGVNNAAITFFRLSSIVIISTLLTLTTPPLELADAIEFLMTPLRKIINVPLWSLMFSVAIRFIPTLMMELQKLMMAQRSRGVRFETGGIIQRAKSFVPILVPLMISTYKRAIDLGTAMTARGFNDAIKRTKYRQMRWQKQDTYALFVFCLLLIIIFLGNHL